MNTNDNLNQKIILYLKNNKIPINLKDKNNITYDIGNIIFTFINKNYFLFDKNLNCDYIGNFWECNIWKKSKYGCHECKI